MFLVSSGAVVHEVPAAYTKRNRKNASQRGKTDRLDARAIAEVVLRESDRLVLKSIEERIYAINA